MADAASECRVCLSAIEEADMAMVPGCGHVFCASCVVSWSLVNRTCPLCKEEFDSLFVRRDIEGAPLVYPWGDGELGWAERGLTLLSLAPWVAVHKTVPEPPAVHQRAPEAMDGDLERQCYGVLSEEFENSLEATIDLELDELSRSDAITRRMFAGTVSHAAPSPGASRRRSRKR